MRSTPLRAAAHGRTRGGLRKFQRFGAWDQSRGGGLLEVKLQTSQIFFIEIEMNIFGQVTLESPRRQIEFDRSRFGNLADALEAVSLGRGEIGQDFRCNRVAPARPYRQHGWLAGPLPPLVD